MALFKCKMCGASLDVKNGETIIECEYCGTQQTLPKTTDENIQALFNRANLLRQKNEFDKAEALYEKILVADSKEAEAYWGVILCKFGIEYVEDPKTYKRIPTCHRTSYDSIVADEYYKKALENADVVQRGVYEAEAKVIDGIQKGILAISAQEEPYDVFICYKEADENGKRTQDSVIANDIYYQLTQEGFKVFYAAITLEDKLGSAYEPIIFAALNSSKVMLSIGTRAEYFNAVWVKNEWSRFLKMMKNDRSKMLIPCYKGMDAYELPEEFAHLQAQDMGKIGFINDIVRGIKKVIEKDEPKQATVVKETVVSGANTNIAPLLKRAFMFLEDGEWNEAVEYCEKVLDIEPECAEAYLGRLMAELHVKSKEKLKYCDKPFDDKPLYAKLIRFANEDVVSELKQYNNTIRERNEEARKSKIYNTAVSLASQQTPEKQIEAADEFGKIPEYRDAKERAEECFAKSKELAEIKRKDAIYNDALSMMNKNGISSYESAIKQFKSIIDWKDSESKIQECNKKISEFKEQQEKATKKAKAKKRAIIISAISAVVFTLALIFAIIPFVNLLSGNYATYINLYGIEHFEIPEETTEIKENAFKKCRSLKSVTIPDSVTSIGASAFHYCTGLESIIIPDSVTSIESGAFDYCVGLESITIGKGVTTISAYAFSDCYNLKEIKFNATAMNDITFDWCDIFTHAGENGEGVKITIGKNVMKIPARLFYSHTDSLKIMSVDFEEGSVCTSIGEYAFCDNKKLTSIVIPDSVTSIGNYAFSRCDALTSVVIGNGVTNISDYAFSCCYDLTSIEVSANNENYCSIDGNLYTKDLKTLIQYAIGKKDTSFTIPQGVENIGNYAFYDCDALTSVVIGDSVTTIGGNAFYSCGALTSIVIPDSVTTIGDYAFYFCDSLTSIKYRGTKEQWENIAKGYHWDYRWDYYTGSYTNTGSYTITYNYTDGE